MSSTAGQRIRCANVDRQGPSECDPDLIVETLTDDDSRAMYLYATTPVTVRELSEELDLPLSTAYRKVETLQEAGLLMQINEQSRSGYPSHYVRSIERVRVTYDDPMRIECTRNGTTLYCEP